MSKLTITPKTKVLQLIEAYPQLEDILIEYVPSFSRLKNPVLRKTVAKIATLQQAAGIGNIEVSDLINHLRKEVNQDVFTDNIESPYNRVKPEWYNEEKIVQEFDVREMLASGEHPVNQVIADLKILDAGSIYKLIAPFVPVPLIDKALSLDINHWVAQENDNLFFIYFLKDK